MNYKVILAWLLNIANKEPTQDVIDSGLNLIRNEFKQDLDKNNKNVRAYMNKKYNSFLNNDFRKHHKMSAYNLKDISPEFRKILEKRVLNSLNAIKIKDKKLLLDLESRFVNFMLDDKEKTMRNLQENLKVNETLKHSKHYVRNILRDQTQRMNDDIDYINGKLNGAVGLIWHTQNDNRVVGNPSGLYPKGNELHNNHYKRDNVFFALRDSYATQQGLLKAEVFESLEDISKIGRAINCRCDYEYLYDLRDVPSMYLSKKGIDYINKHI